MKKLTTKEFIDRAKLIHGDKYDYTNTIYTGSESPVTIFCKKHNMEFVQSRASKHLSGCGCPKCGKEAGGKAKKDKSKFLQNKGEAFIKEAQKLNPDYDYSKVVYTGTNNNVIIVCPTHGEFEQTPHNHLYLKTKCPKCSCVGFSSQEKELVDYLKTLSSNEIIENDRTILEGKELDILIPSLNIAIEYDGLYWHNNLNNYYKFEKCREKGIRLIQINEWEWKVQNDKIKQYLKSIIVGTEKKVFARKCSVKEIDNETYRAFTNNNHLQGWCVASVKLGLFYNDELIQVMSFGKSRYSKDSFEMIRECSKAGYSVVGGKSKLLSYFEKNYNPDSIVSYCEKNKFSGISYLKCGFTLERESDPGYSYYKNNQKFSRVSFQKFKLKDKLETFDPNLTETENMLLNGYYKLYDYGNFVFIKHYNHQ